MPTTPRPRHFFIATPACRRNARTVRGQGQREVSGATDLMRSRPQRSLQSFKNRETLMRRTSGIGHVKPIPPFYTLETSHDKKQGRMRGGTITKYYKRLYCQMILLKHNRVRLSLSSDRLADPLDDKLMDPLSMAWVYPEDA